MGSQNITTDPQWTAHTLQRGTDGGIQKGVLQVCICKDGDPSCHYGNWRAILSADGTQWIEEQADTDGNEVVIAATSQAFRDARAEYLAQIDAEVAALDAASKVQVG